MGDYFDFRKYIDLLRSEGELIDIKDNLMPEPDVGAVCQAATDMDGPALMMNVSGYSIPLVAGAHTSMRRIALSMGMPKETSARDIFYKYSERWNQYPIPPEEVASKDAPCKELVYRNEEVDITQLPIVRWNTGDGGPYIAKGTVITRDIDTGIVNFAINRLQLKGPRELNIWPGLYHGIGTAYRKAVSSGKPLEVVIVIGNEPAVSMASVSSLPEEWDEFAFAGALKGSPIQVTKAETSDLPVPAHAEIVLEGVIYPNLEDRDIEGPFTEFTGHNYGVHKCPIVHIHTMTTRKNPIYEGLYSGRGNSESDMMTRIPISASLYRAIKQHIPEITGFYTVSTVGTVSVASIKQSRGGQAKQLIHLLWGLSGGVRTKYLFVVDDDVDPFNMEQVMWALSTRFRGLDDLVVAEKTFGVMLDPSAKPQGIVTRLGFDLTWPIPPDTVPDAGPAVKGWPQSKDWRRYLENIMSGKPAESPKSELVFREFAECPRCASPDRTVFMEQAEWKMMKCGHCNYVWRNTELDVFMDHKIKTIDNINFHPPKNFGK